MRAFVMFEATYDESRKCCGRRYFPLRRSDTVAWAEEAPSPLAQLLRGIADAFRALPLPPEQLAAGLRQVAAVQACAFAPAVLAHLVCVLCDPCQDARAVR